MTETAIKSQRGGYGKRPPARDWHPADIVAELRKAGWSVRQLSIKSGLAPNTLADALRKPYRRGEEIIARELRTRPERIWPSRYKGRRG
jgi:Ner family transcriptional regulator